MGRALRRKPVGAAGCRATTLLLQIAKAWLTAIAFAISAGRGATTAMACVTLVAAAKATLGGRAAVAMAIATAGRVAKAALAATTTAGKITTLGGGAAQAPGPAPQRS